VRAIEVERTQLVDGKAVGTGEFRAIPADLVVSCIGYQTPLSPACPMMKHAGVSPMRKGASCPALLRGLGAAGPSGTIGTNRPDGFAIVERIAQDIGTAESGKPGRPGFDALAAERGWTSSLSATGKDRRRRDRARAGSPARNSSMGAMMGAAKQ
jgi:ferredoxin--NADP+ reductase